jgi:two-component system, OmpR family, phosphate regulon sensor histidine kinase PhoR
LIGAICAGLAFLVTHSVPVAALVTTIVILSLLLGWMCASWFYNPLTPNMDPSTLPAGTLDPFANAMRFARKAIEATPTPVIIVDQSGAIIMSNEAARARFSLGISRARFATAIRRPDLLNAVDQVLATRQPVTLAMETRVPVDRYERASVAAFDVTGVAFVMLSLTDETEARMSERMRADFLANASHELRTPLAAIIGFIETLRGPAREDTPARDRFLEVMYHQADRMSRLISDLLSLSRIELNEHVPPTHHSDMALLVHDSVTYLHPDQKKRLDIVVARQPVWVLCDPDEIIQVLTNLVDNALKYGDPDQPIRIFVDGGLNRDDAMSASMRQWEDATRLSLTTPEHDRDRHYGIVRIENGGAGIERQFLPRLSERFFRVEDSASGTSGTGLGLAIVKHILSRHRGGLTVESELGRGVAFGFYLPMPTMAVPEDDAT